MDSPPGTHLTEPQRRMLSLIARYANEMNEELAGLDVRPLLQAAAHDASRAPTLGEANHRLTLVLEYLRRLLVERHLRPGKPQLLPPEVSNYLAGMPSTRPGTSANLKR